MNGYRVDDQGNQVSGIPNGAVAVHGSGVLSSYADNGRFAESVLARQVAGKTLGEAIEATRATLPLGSVEIFAWLLLGDPTLRVD